MKEELKNIIENGLDGWISIEEATSYGLIKSMQEHIESHISSNYVSKNKVMEIIERTYVLGGKHTISEIEEILKKKYDL